MHDGRRVVRDVLFIYEEILILSRVGFHLNVILMLG